MCWEYKKRDIDFKNFVSQLHFGLLYVLHFCVSLKVGLFPNKALSGRPLMTNLDF